MTDFLMPSLGADMERGTLVEWRIRAGDAVKRGDVVALVETEKGLIEIEIWMDGTVESLLVSEGATVPVGAVLATIRGSEAAAALPGAAAAPPVVERPPAPPLPPVAGPAPRAPAVLAPSAHPAAGAEPRRRVSPAARKRALDLGVDLAAVTGTGEGGAVTSADVERAAAARREAAPAVPAPADRQAAMRRAIAAAMARSKREIPHYYLGTHVDMTAALAWLAAENQRRPVTERLLYSVLLLRAVALAAREVPEMNGFWGNDVFRAATGVHVGVAISLRQGGLVAPAIHDVDQKPLDQLMREMLDLVQRARTGVLRSSEVSDATITVTNLGEQGVELVWGVIYPPQVALVGFGKVIERPWASAGALGVRPVIAATLAGDHRASDGHRGGRFLAIIDRLLQEPEKL